jgi:isoleucyl-tRNA synthetase
MDANTLNRREKRHYRRLVNGEIVYTTSPIDEKSSSPSSSDYKEKIGIEKSISKNSSMNKKELMDKVLDNMSDVINPNLDTIADTIYEQLKENNIDFEKKVIKNVVTKHYRSGSSNVSKEGTGKLVDEEIDRDKLKLVVDDLYEQIETENKTEKIEKEASKEKEVKESIKKDTEKKKQVIKTKEKEEQKKVKEKEQVKLVKKNEVSKQLLEDDGPDLSDDESDDSDDDLGLKF